MAGLGGMHGETWGTIRSKRSRILGESPVRRRKPLFRGVAVVSVYCFDKLNLSEFGFYQVRDEGRKRP